MSGMKVCASRGHAPLPVASRMSGMKDQFQRNAVTGCS